MSTDTGLRLTPQEALARDLIVERVARRHRAERRRHPSRTALLLRSLADRLDPPTAAPTGRASRPAPGRSPRGGPATRPHGAQPRPGRPPPAARPTGTAELGWTATEPADGLSAGRGRVRPSERVRAHSPTPWPTPTSPPSCGAPGRPPRHGRPDGRPDVTLLPVIVDGRPGRRPPRPRQRPLAPHRARRRRASSSSPAPTPTSHRAGTRPRPSTAGSCRRGTTARCSCAARSPCTTTPTGCSTSSRAHPAARGARERPWAVTDAPPALRPGPAAGDRRHRARRRASVEGKAKLSQNRSDADRRGVIAGLRAEGGPAAQARGRRDGAALEG